MKLFILFALGIVCDGVTFKPVVLVHGILSGPEKMLVLVDEIGKVNVASVSRVSGMDNY